VSGSRGWEEPKLEDNEFHPILSDRLSKIGISYVCHKTFNNSIQILFISKKPEIKVVDESVEEY
jgi:hypothetical protein